MGGPYGDPAQPPESSESAADRPIRRPSGATAVIAALLGLAAAVIAGYVPVTVFLGIPSGFSLGDLPLWTLVDLGAYLVAGLVLLLGALGTIFRATAGAVLLILGALLAIGALLVESTLVSTAGYAAYFQSAFGLHNTPGTARAALCVLAPLVLVLSALPPTFSYLRYRTPVARPYGAHSPGQW
ncbi:hypothetical protein [Amycolatopsis saalfeldensis]|uniref:Uncharacterized protein n=1 Tax=Amycolatopsis saalfeldensis TaxID=394193 RepID=A0A1H8R8J2_9PSEU|nr:hypothetical protein [Amycolatopsis saalfeldensis]SEO62775.1 hypothetical protein SAMN04489732_101677 [Amycolatopsis saalfeldensis]